MSNIAQKRSTYEMMMQNFDSAVSARKLFPRGCERFLGSLKMFRAAEESNGELRNYLDQCVQHVNDTILQMNGYMSNVLLNY